MSIIPTLATLFSVLVPARVWVPPGQPLQVMVQAEGAIVLVASDFTGKVLEKGTSQVAGGRQVDLAALFPTLAVPGTYLVFAVPVAKTLADPETGNPPPPFYRNFIGTPLVIGVRADKRLAGAAEAIVTRIAPLRYATIATDHGTMTVGFYYDAAPNTVSTLCALAEQGFYDGLSFHRVVPGFLVQGGDPRGDGRGGPGFSIEAEFSDRKHVPGVLSMARQGDPMEASGLKPRSEFANTAGSQFFIVLEPNAHLDGRYTAFGQVIDGEEVYEAIASAPVADKATGRPVKAPVITRIELHPVTARNNPYAGMLSELKTQQLAPPQGPPAPQP